MKILYKLLLIFTAINIIFFVITRIYNNNKSLNVSLDSYKNNNEILSMMLETEVKSGKYQKVLLDKWPQEGYLFNQKLSKCEKGSNISWNDDKNKIVIKGNGGDKCYIYFDKTISLVTYIKTQYTGIQGENNLYFHDSTLTNGAGDNSYRYAGSSDTTNNFVCFGYDSTDGTCPTDYLYRIIGIFDKEVKLIKYDYAKSSLLGTDGDYSQHYSSNGTNKGENKIEEIGSYYWNKTTNNNTWSESKLNAVNLNTNYLKNIGTNWSNKIATHTWKVGGNTWNNLGTVNAFTSYQNEIVTPSSNLTYNAKVGLMYINDYSYAASQNAWTRLLSYDNGNGYCNSEVTNVNWMHMGLYDWIITPRAGISNLAFLVYFDGRVNGYNVGEAYAVRPSFYLNENVVYISGSGTKIEPFIIK